MQDQILVESKTDFGIIPCNDKAMASSRFVAGYFKKNHQHILEAFRKLECSEEFRLSNYRQSYYRNEQNKKQPEVLMTKDGFIFLVMGFTGKKAAQFKEAYIHKFNEMEQAIHSRNAAKLEHPDFTDAIKANHEEPKHYHYSNESDFINLIVLGIRAKEFRLKHGIAQGQSIRDHLTACQIEMIQKLQKADTSLMFIMPDSKQRRAALQAYYDKITTQLALPCASNGG